MRYQGPTYWRRILYRPLHHALRPLVTLRWIHQQTTRIENTHYLVTTNHGGTHWLRLQIALYLEAVYNLTGDPVDLKRFEIVPPLHRKKYLFRYNRNTAIPRVQQTHAHFIKRHFENASVILLVRDLRDSLVSYYRTLVERSSPNLTFSDFLRERNLPKTENYIHGLSQRIAFLNSWSINQHRLQALHVVKFEDMRESPDHELRKIISFLKLPKEESSIEYALSGTSIEEMSRLEKTKTQQKSRPSTKIRSGITKAYRDYFSDSDQKYFQDYIQSHLLDSFGYDYFDWE